MKTKLILKSLADLPANTLSLAAAMPGHALEMARRVLAPPARATRRQMRAARQRSANFMNDLSARANTPLKMNNFWVHGGLNE